MTRVAYHFHGITVIVPFQLPTKTELVPIDKGSLVSNPAPFRENEYRVTRLIANIALFTRQDYETGNFDNPVSSFDPPIELRVGYNFYDILRSGGELQNLQLAYWDGVQWIVISDAAHEYQVLPPSTGQVAEVKIWEWVGDPPLAWIT